MSLVTRCPKCNNDFVVKLEQLQALDGLVRCGACAHIFDGFASLQSQLPTLTQRPTVASTEPSVVRARADRTEPAVLRQRIGAAEPSVLRSRTDSPAPSLLNARAEPEAPSVLRSRAEPLVTDSSRVSFSARSEPPVEHDESAAEMSIVGESRLRGEGASVGRTQPEFLVDEVDTPRLLLLLWGLASALAFALLVVQLAYVYRNDLATHFPSLRPALQSLCTTFKCDVSLRRYLERISVSVVAFERQPGADQEGRPAEMTLRFSLRNRLNQPQPWPHLSLELTDASGTVVLRKRLSPNEYLPATLVDQPFARGQEVNLVLPVSVTGLQINGYTLKPFFP
jgi:predicted Zn finger-like uncharacterized protein